MKNSYLFFSAASLIAGIIVASQGKVANLHPGIFTAFILVLFAIFFIFRKNEKLFIILLFTLFFLLGSARYEVYNMIGKNDILRYATSVSEKVVVEGMVISDVNTSLSKRKKTFIIETNLIKFASGRQYATHGKALVSSYKTSNPDINYGDIVMLEGNLRTPFFYGGRGFSYKKYLENKKIYVTLNIKNNFLLERIGVDNSPSTKFKKSLISLRNIANDRINRFLAKPYSSLASAILLGERRSINSKIWEIFKKTGVLHILAISGLHVGIIYFILRIILKMLRFSRVAGIVLSVLFLICYAMLAGGRASVIRAVVMFSILAIGQILKRKMAIYNLIGLSALVILIANPNQVFDIGFILSYGAVLSIVYFSPKIYAILNPKRNQKAVRSVKEKVKDFFLGSIAVSLSAWLGLTPLTAHFFGTISPIVVVANLIAVPLLFFIMGSGLAFLSIGFISVGLAQVLSESMWFFLILLVKSMNALSHIPFAYLEIGRIPVYMVVYCYIGLIVLFSLKIKHN